MVRIALTALVASTGCRDPLCGPVGEAIDPVLVLQSTLDALTRAPIDEVTLRDIRLDGKKVNARWMFPADGSQGVVLSDDVVSCRGLCAFSSSEGRYDMRLESPGYVPRAVTIDARFQRSRTENCKVLQSGSTVVQFELTPQANNSRVVPD